MSPSKVHWYRRLSVRYGILVALTIIAFIKIQPVVMEAVSGWFGVRVRDPFIRVTETVPFADEDAANSFPTPEPRPMPGDVVAGVMAAGEVSTAGTSRVPLEVALRSWGGAVTSDYVVAGPDLIVIESNIPGLERGSTMPAEREFAASYLPVKSTAGDLRWLCLPTPEARSSASDASMPAFSYPGGRAGSSAKTALTGLAEGMSGGASERPQAIPFIALTKANPIGASTRSSSQGAPLIEEPVPEDYPVFDRESGKWTVNGYELDSTVLKKGGTLPDGTPVLTRAEERRQEANYRTIEIIVSWALPISAALLLGMLVSWMITRRIVRLSEAAGDPAIDSFELLGLEGNDEIARLGEALSDSRGRATGLVRELAERDAQRREWFAQVSHDLRTPLTALSACLDRAMPMVTSVPEGPGREELVRTIEVARQDTERVHRLATDLLDVARLELPDALRLEETLPEEVAERVVMLLSPIAEREGVSLLLETPNLTESAEVVPVEADPSRLMRVLENLVRNGIEHAESKVTVRVRHQEGGARITVLDDGRGFSDSETGPSADPADPRGAVRADSAGLGLVVVMRALEAHGSALELSNRASGGAKASFWLPACSVSVDPELDEGSTAAFA